MAFRGLITDPNELAITGDGAMRAFTNGVLRRAQLAQRRPGLQLAALNASAPFNKLWNYDSQVLAHVGSGATGQFKSIADGDVDVPTGIVGQVNPVSGRLRGCISGKNFYAAGTVPWRLSGIGSTPVAAGGLFAPGFDPARTLLPAGAVLVVGSKVAYRTCFGLTDAKGNLHLGEVSGRLIVINTAGATANPTVRVLVPSTATTSHFVQLYRSAVVLSSATADDDLQLVFEQQLKTTDISAGYVEITDVVPDGLRGATIYTASTQDGIAGSNRAPPACTEVCNHAGRTWYGNTIQPGEFDLHVLAVGGTSGILSGDVLSFTGLTNAFTLTAIRDFWCSLTRVGTTVTATTTEAHGYSTNDYVMFQTPGADFGIGPFQITVTGTYAFTYTDETGSEVTLAGQLVNKSTVSGPANGTYVVRADTNGGTVASRVTGTIQNIAAALNKHTTNTELWAQILEPSDEPLPYLHFRGRTAATYSFFVSAGAGSQRDCFSPQLMPQDHTASLTRATNVVTGTVTANSFKVGEKVLIAPGGAGSGTSVFGAGPFTITSVNATTFVYSEDGDDGTLAAQNAQLTPQDIGSAEEEIKPNRIYYSKVEEHEATTRTGWIDVGDPATGIRAMLSLRNFLYVWKTDGIYRIIGGWDSSVVPADLDVVDIDTSVRLLAVESVVVFSGRCWGLTDRGVVAVAESGLEVMDGAISDDLRRMAETVDYYAADVLAAGYGTIDVDLDCFATAYEATQEYILHVPAVFASSGNFALDGAGKYGGCPMAFVFNVATNSWSFWDWGANTGDYVNAKRCALEADVDGHLWVGDGYNGSAGDGYLYRDRKSLTSADYRDTVAEHSVTQSLTRVASTVTATGASPPPFSIGDSIRITPGSANFGEGPHTVTGVSGNTFTYTESGAPVTLAAQTAFLEQGIPLTWSMVLQTNDAPGHEKRWDELKFIFAQMATYFPSQRTNSQKAFNLALANETASVAAFEVASQETQVSRVWVDADVARGTRLLVTITQSTVDEAFDLSGFGIKCEVLDGASTR